jgi:putative hydrolase of HD superfamily
MQNRVDKILAFLQEIEKYKTIEREMFCSNLNRAESDAEHSWHIAMFLILFENDLPQDIDMKKMLKLALMHDLVEIYAGDTFAYDKQNQATKKERESKAAKKLFSQLPKDLNKEFMNLFDEYEEIKTKEAKIVKSFDKIQPILQNLCSSGKSWQKHKITFSDIDQYKRKYVEHNDLILGIYEKLLNDARDKNLI